LPFSNVLETWEYSAFCLYNSIKRANDVVAHGDITDALCPFREDPGDKRFEGGVGVSAYFGQVRVAAPGLAGQEKRCMMFRRQRGVGVSALLDLCLSCLLQELDLTGEGLDGNTMPSETRPSKIR
jgi:hypothetical protein